MTDSATETTMSVGTIAETGIGVLTEITVEIAITIGIETMGTIETIKVTVGITAATGGETEIITKMTGVKIVRTATTMAT